jgi:hypothetical protein
MSRSTETWLVMATPDDEVGEWREILRHISGAMFHTRGWKNRSLLSQHHGAATQLPSGVIPSQHKR